MSGLVTKHPGGRPTKYDPAFCGRVVELGRLGKSRAYIAAEINVSRECLEEWERVHPEFSDAMDEAMLHSQKWWEDAGQSAMTAGPGMFNAAVWSRSMSARFSRDWRDKHIKVDIPKITDAASLQNAQSRVAEALAKGSVDTEGGATLMTTLNSIAKTMEMVDLEKRLIALEEYVKSSKAAT